MNIESVKFRGHRCFTNDWSGFDTFKPVNVIIGRNNTGKTLLLELVSALCKGSLEEQRWSFLFQGAFDEDSLKSVFSERANGGPLGGIVSHWNDHGIHFKGASVEWELDHNWRLVKRTFLNEFDPTSQFGSTSTKNRLANLDTLLTNIFHRLYGLNFRRLLAERNIGQEKEGSTPALGEDGHGATNIIRKYILSSDPRYPREIIQHDLLKALNEVFGKDGQFDEIQVKVHDVNSPRGSIDHWEVYLGEKKKGGLIPLSSSGSGLKTVILVLLNLIVVPKIYNESPSKYCFAFEELENNLHPALLRRLLRFIQDFATRENSVIFLTTHSNVALDLFGTSSSAQIIHVTHNGESAKARTIDAHFDKLGVISELGAKPSDLLQANGILWVEGPSDRIYLNRWIELFSNGKLREGRDYQCAFYGGALLARTQFVSPEIAESELVNLFRVNPNIIVVCDGDRIAASEDGSELKDRVKRIKAEVENIPNAHIWITDAKEIENYLTGEALCSALNLSNLPDPGKFERFFPKDNDPQGISYVESHLKRKSMDKMELASSTCPHMTQEMINQRFELAEQITKIIEKIESWNT
jgi:hypothetical protein